MQKVTKPEDRAFTDRWYVSPFNFADEVRNSMSLPERVILRDSTLREGIETPTSSWTWEDKLKVLEGLVDLGLQEIELGYPLEIKEYADMVREVRKRKYPLKVSAFLLQPLTRETALQRSGMLKDIGVDRAQVTIGTSKFLAKHQASLHDRTVEDALKMGIEFAVTTITAAKEQGMEAELGCVDATRADLDYLRRICTAAQEAGVDRILVYDTNGCILPSATRYLIRKMREFVKVPMSFHSHEDIGVSTAATLAAIEEGCDSCDVVLNGLGDRAGNACFEQVAIALELLYGVKTGLHIDRIYPLSKLVEKVSGIPMQGNRAWVGDFTFLHTSDYHAASILRGEWSNQMPVNPEVFGRENVVLFGESTLGGKSIEVLMDQMGLPHEQDNVEEIADKIREELKKKESLTVPEVKELIQVWAA